MRFSQETKSMPDLKPYQPPIGPPKGFTPPTTNPTLADYELLKTLACLRVLNRAQVLYVWRKLAAISDEEAERILWQPNQIPHSKLVTVREHMILLYERGWVRPWRTLDADTDLVLKIGPPPFINGIFFFLGPQGKEHLKLSLRIKTLPRPTDELYCAMFPFLQGITASNIALLLTKDGYVLESPAQKYQQRKDVPPSLVHPDFLVSKGPERVAGFVAGSPHPARVDWYVGNIARNLANLPGGAKAVIFTRTQAAFNEIMFSLQAGYAMKDYSEQIYVSDLKWFRQTNGHPRCLNLKGVKFTL